MVDKLIDILLKILTNLSQWLYNIQVNWYSKDISSVEIIDLDSNFDINELSQNDLINRKNELKTKLWESLEVKHTDNHWYNNSYIVGGLILGSLIILGGAYYYFYYYKNSDIPVDSISNHDTTNDHSSFSDNEAGTSNDIELQESKPSDSVINTYSDNDPWAGTMSDETRADMDHYFPHRDNVSAQSRSSSPSGSDVTVTPKSIIQPTYQGDEEANFIEYGKRVLNRK